MSDLDLQEMAYFIHDRHLGRRPVFGFAIKSKIPVRLCVRHVPNGPREGWVIDHYDSGLHVSGPNRTMKAAIRYGLRMVAKNIADGTYAKAIKKAEARISALPLQSKRSRHDE